MKWMLVFFVLQLALMVLLIESTEVYVFAGIASVFMMPFVLVFSLISTGIFEKIRLKFLQEKVK